MLVLALGLTSCRGDAGNELAARNPLDCFPAEARPWIHREAAERAAPARRAAPGRRAETARIYVDRSGSMVGYLRSERESERPFEELILNLPAMLNRQGLASKYRAFGVDFLDLDTDDRNQLATRGFYSSPNSHLDDVFEAIAAERGRPALVISDLWMSHPSEPNSALGSLNEPLTRILADGRSIAVYGIAAPFNGVIDDMPSGEPAVRFTGAHPLFLVAVGTDEQLAALDEALFNAPTPHLAGAMANGQVRRTLFSPTPALAVAASADPFGAVDHPALQRIPVIEVPGSRIQQFRLDRGAALRMVGNRDGSSPTWSGPRAEGFARGSVWQGTFRTRTRVWQRRGDSCTAEDWLDGPRLPDSFWTQRGDSHSFMLRPDALAAELPEEGIYLIAGELIRTSLVRRGAAVTWMYDWSFGAGTSPNLTLPDNRPLFRTLYLSEFARLLEVALADAAARRPAPVQGFAVVVRLED